MFSLSREYWKNWEWFRESIETHEKQEKLGVSGDSECGGEIC